MLRGTQPIRFDGDTQGVGAARADENRDETAGMERRRHPRLRLDEPPPNPSRADRRQGDRRQGERRQGDRRSIESLRSEMNWTAAPDARGGFDPLNLLRRVGLKPSRLLLLVLAIASGGLAAYMAAGNDGPAAPPEQQTLTEVVAEPRVRVLVATAAIGIGQRLTADAVGWEEWPEGAVLSDYVTEADTPDAVGEMANAVARFDLVPGDPIRTQKIMTDSAGYLSAVLQSGRRGVSVPVAAEAASGGFISPNDRVDVVLTRQTPGAGLSETVLHNVRVLAINSQLGEAGPSGDGNAQNAQPAVFGGQAIATLALTPTEAEVIMSAVQMGRISLMLRAMSDAGEKPTAGQRASNQAIRMSSPFWSDDYPRRLE